VAGKGGWPVGWGTYLSRSKENPLTVELAADVWQSFNSDGSSECEMEGKGRGEQDGETTDDE
jgi:hypothetical protein